jgi:hypothetical protein
MNPEIRKLLEKLPHKTQVSFALYCAEDAFSIIKEQKNEAELCINLVKEWLRNPDRPGLEKELKAAGDSAVNVAVCLDVNSSYASAHAAAYSVATSVYPAYYPYYDCTYSATHAAYAYFYIGTKNHNIKFDEKIHEYYGVLMGYLTKVEKELYLSEEK